jgi:hypothetical protein
MPSLCNAVQGMMSLGHCAVSLLAGCMTHSNSIEMLAAAADRA